MKVTPTACQKQNGLHGLTGDRGIPEILGLASKSIDLLLDQWQLNMSPSHQGEGGRRTQILKKLAKDPQATKPNNDAS